DGGRGDGERHGQFDGDGGDGAPGLREVVGGTSETLLDSLVTFCPSGGACRGFARNSCAPRGATWGVDGRTVGLGGPGGGKRGVGRGAVAASGQGRAERRSAGVARGKGRQPAGWG
ncbi:hypothetical protein B1218_36140, partial [Pseudomonas ogarae]